MKMNKLKYLSIIGISLVIGVSPVFAWTVSETGFYYDGTAANDKIGTKIWRGRTVPYENRKMTVMVEGVPDSGAPGTCANVKNCKGDNCWFSWLPEVDTFNQTGLFLGTYYTPKCPDSYWMGFSYFGTAYNGMSMRTWTGNKPYNESGSFWKTVPSTEYRDSTNQGISAIYASLPTNNIMKPWSANCSGNNCEDKIRVAIISYDEVKEAHMDQPKNMELQQGFAVNFIQKNCPHWGECQLQVNLKTHLSGKYSNNKPVISNADAAMGNMGWIAGSIGSAGISSKIPNTNKLAWTSWGSKTQAGSYSTRRFQVEISWKQFKNILHAVSGGNEAKKFGSGWNNRYNWILGSVSFGQEVFNPKENESSNNKAYIGGNVKRLQVLSISH